MVTSHNYGNNVCVVKERSIKDIGLGYNNLYITMKKLCTRCKYNQKTLSWKAYRVCITTAQHTQHSMDNKQYEKPYKFESNRNIKDVGFVHM